MHMVIFIWGFTGVIGKLLNEVPVHSIVFYRMLIGFLAVGLFMLITRRKLKMKPKVVAQVAGTGVIIAAHWITFFLSIYYSNVSFALIFFSTTALFTSFLEPLLMKRRFDPTELIMGAVVVAGISVIGYDSMMNEKNEVISYTLAMVCAIVSAFLAALFSVINAIFVIRNDSVEITFYELIAGCIGIGITYFATGDLNMESLALTNNELYLLLVLGIVCTAFAFFMGNWLMKFISPFTMNLNINMEPIYAIIIALIIFQESEVMSPVFYIGASVIIGAVVFNAYLKAKRTRKNRIATGKDVLDNQSLT